MKTRDFRKQLMATQRMQTKMTNNLTKVIKNANNLRNHDILRVTVKKTADLKKKEQHAGNFVCNDPRTTEKPEIVFKSTNPVPRDREWWIDSGASQHMTPDKRGIANYCTFESPLKLNLADDSVLRFYGKGDVHLSVSNGTENVNIVLNDVLYVPKLQNKLFSLP